jgi:hypothetical protein
LGRVSYETLGIGASDPVVLEIYGHLGRTWACDDIRRSRCRPEGTVWVKSYWKFEFVSSACCEKNLQSIPMMSVVLEFICHRQCTSDVHPVAGIHSENCMFLAQNASFNWNLGQAESVVPQNPVNTSITFRSPPATINVDPLNGIRIPVDTFHISSLIHP